MLPSLAGAREKGWTTDEKLADYFAVAMYSRIIAVNTDLCGLL